MCNKAVANYPHPLEFVPKWNKTQEMFYKAVNRCFLYLILFLINIKLKKYVTYLFLYILFLIVYCLDKYKTQKICDEAVDDCLAALKFIPD